MMGALFMLAIFGFVLGIIALFFKRTRRYSVYIAFPCILASLCSFFLFLGPGLLLEKLLGGYRCSYSAESGHFMNIFFHFEPFCYLYNFVGLIGYVSGLFFGGILGLYLAIGINAFFEQYSK